jgi:hypothetical protein
LADEAFRADLIVEGAAIVEVKSVSELASAYARQFLTCLRLLDLRVGLRNPAGRESIRPAACRVLIGMPGVIHCLLGGSSESDLESRLWITRGLGRLR